MAWEIFNFQIGPHLFNLAHDERVYRAIYTMTLSFPFTVVRDHSCAALFLLAFSVVDRDLGWRRDVCILPIITCIRIRWSIHNHHRQPKFHPTSPVRDYNMCTAVPPVNIIVVLRACCCWCRASASHRKYFRMLSFQYRFPHLPTATTQLYRNVTYNRQ